MDSKYVKKCLGIRKVANGVGVGGGELTLSLNRDHLIAEHKFSFGASQSHTNAPTSVDPRDFIESVEFSTDKGRLAFMTGAQFYDIGRYFEAGSAVVSTLAAGAASTAFWSTELHHEMSASTLDLLTALRSAECSSVNVTFKFAADAANGFKGGSVPLATSYTVEVESFEYPGMISDVQFGQLLGSASQFHVKHGAKKGTTAGSLSDLALRCGNLTRAIMLHAYDTTGAAPVLSNAILDNTAIVLDIGGDIKRNAKGFNVRQHNLAVRSFGQTGVYVLDAGDAPEGYFDLRHVAQATLKLEAQAGCPAGYTIEVLQVEIKPNR